MLTITIRALRTFYGLLPAPPEDLFQFFVWEILSATSLPARRDHAWNALKQIPALTPDAMFRAPSKALLEAVALGGPHREHKVEQLRATVDVFKRHRDALHAETLRRGRLLSGARALRMLTHLDGDIRSRAWLFAAGMLVLPVDDEVSRVVTRLMRKTLPASRTVSAPRERNRSRRVARRWLVTKLPPEIGAYREAVTYLLHHAQYTCLTVAPHCTVCPLRVDCPSSVVRRPPPVFRHDGS